MLCSRFKNKHMAEHAAATGHLVAVSLSDMSVWCFACDAYLDAFCIRGLHDAFRGAYAAKFDGAEPDLPAAAVELAVAAPAAGDAAAPPE